MEKPLLLIDLSNHHLPIFKENMKKGGFLITSSIFIVFVVVEKFHKCESNDELDQFQSTIK